MASKRVLAWLLMASVGTIAAAQSAAAQVQAPGAYRINPGDELEIYVWGEDKLPKSVRVLPDGTFGFPLVGQVDARGRLPSEIEALITRGLESSYRGAVPQVTVSVRNPSGMQFSVIGKVRSPGTFTPGRYVNALEALSMAGGPTEFAQLGNILIIRNTTGGPRTIRVRLSEILKGNAGPSDLSADGFAQIQSGDTVVVP